MKKIIYFIISAILVISCKSTSVTPSSSSSKKEKEPLTEIQSKPDILLGIQNREALQKTPFSNWFNSNFKEYTLNTAIVQQLVPQLKDVSIKAFMGTWCSDSKRETPALYKILDATNFNYDNLELITVSRKKDTPDQLEKGLDIQRVPTFIFYKNGKEIGRYVEFPRETLEKDILSILTDTKYKHSYED